MVGVTARDVMSREFVGVSEGDGVGDVLDLMVEQAVDDVLVLRGSEPVGVVSSHDVLETAANGGVEGAESVQTLMDPPPETLSADDDIGTVLARLSSTHADQLPVANGQDELVGVVTDADVIAAATSLVSQPDAVEVGPGGEAASEYVQPDQNAADHAGAVSRSEAATSAQDTSTQGVCESCGTLTADLQVANGQSICSNCRDV